MIFGIGVDHVDIDRFIHKINASDEKLIAKIFTPQEIADASIYKNPLRRYKYFAKRFAAKEAISKAFRTGIGSTLGFHDIYIGRAINNAPTVEINTKSLNKISKNATFNFHISLADELNIATAFVVIERMS